MFVKFSLPFGCTLPILNVKFNSFATEKSFNTRYKGYGLYGVGAPRADYLGTVKVKAQLALA